MKYSRKVMDRVKAPRFGGPLPPGGRACTGLVTSTICSDVLQLQILIGEAGEVRAARHKTFGCPAAVASADWVCGWLEGQQLDAVMKLDSDEVFRSLELPAEKRHCPDLARDAVVAALENFAERPEQHGANAFEQRSN